jgi:hypothetical protein
MEKWLDKYKTPKAQNGIEGTMGGLTDIGFDYNGAWGGPSMAMGGSLSGPTGMFYARVGAPSNGKYAKKTMASAQNGMEMKYYQDGLDFRPKTISQNGSLITPYGQWEYPGEITTIPSNQITMQGVPYPVLGISDTGDTRMMYPGEDYTFDGESVTEYPVMQKGGRVPIYVDNPNDPRLRAYQDSLSLHNKEKKIYETETGLKYSNLLASKRSNIPDGPAYGYTLSGKPLYGYKKPVQPVEYRKSEPPTLYVDDLNNPRLKAYQDSLMLSSRSRNNPNSMVSIQQWEKSRGKGSAAAYKEKGMMPIGIREFSEQPYRASEPVFAKPKQKVEYRKPQPKKEEPVKKTEQPKLVEKKQNVYEGTPLYSPGAGSGLPSSLVGFVNKGDTTFIKPEDYERFAVPKYGREYIESKKKKNGGWLEKYK